MNNISPESALWSAYINKQVVDGAANLFPLTSCYMLVIGLFFI